VPLVAWPPTLFGTLKGFQTSHARSDEQSSSSLGSRYAGLEEVIRIVWTRPGSAAWTEVLRSLNLVAHHYFLSRYAVYKVETEVHRMNFDTRISPLTLDCFISTQDTLSRRCIPIRFSKSQPSFSGSDENRRADSPTGIRQESEGFTATGSPRGVERKGIEPLTPGLQSRCSPS
jgi:hypothetical protein